MNSMYSCYFLSTSSKKLSLQGTISGNELISRTVNTLVKQGVEKSPHDRFQIYSAFLEGEACSYGFTSSIGAKYKLENEIPPESFFRDTLLNWFSDWKRAEGPSNARQREKLAIDLKAMAAHLLFKEEFLAQFKDCPSEVKIIAAEGLKLNPNSEAYQGEKGPI